MIYQFGLYCEEKDERKGSILAERIAGIEPFLCLAGEKGIFNYSLIRLNYGGAESWRIMVQKIKLLHRF